MLVILNNHSILKSSDFKAQASSPERGVVIAHLLLSDCPVWLLG